MIDEAAEVGPVKVKMNEEMNIVGVLCCALRAHNLLMLMDYRSHDARVSYASEEKKNEIQE